MHVSIYLIVNSLKLFMCVRIDIEQLGSCDVIASIVLLGPYWSRLSTPVSRDIS